MNCLVSQISNIQTITQTIYPTPKKKKNPNKVYSPSIKNKINFMQVFSKIKGILKIFLAFLAIIVLFCCRYKRDE